MNVLSIGSDRRIFEKNSAVRKRISRYGSLFDEYYVIVYSLKSHNLPKVDKISGNTWAITTNSESRFDYVSDAVKIGGEMTGIDLITSQDPFESGWAAVKLAEKLNAKLNVQVHTDFMNRHFRYSGTLNFIRTLMAPRVLKKADTVRVVSERIKRSLKDKYDLKARVSVLPIYVNLKKAGKKNEIDLHGEYPAFSTIVLSVSRLEKEKNLELALSAMKEIIKRHPRTGYVILGEGREGANLEKMAKRLGIDKSVIFEGWVRDPGDYYKSADIYLSTSKYEGYGLALIEASAFGTPVVTTDVGVVGDILMGKINSMVCSVGDKKCLVESLLRLIEDKDFYKLIKRNALNVARHLEGQSETEYLKRYREALLGG